MKIIENQMNNNMKKVEKKMGLIGTCLIILSVQIMVLLFTITQSPETKTFGLILVAFTSYLYGYVAYRYLAFKK